MFSTAIIITMNILAILLTWICNFSISANNKNGQYDTITHTRTRIAMVLHSTVDVAHELNPTKLRQKHPNIRYNIMKNHGVNIIAKLILDFNFCSLLRSNIFYFNLFPHL